MIPTGFKLYAGIAGAALLAAAIGGYTTGGTVVGPISAGYKGGIGHHVSYVVLVGVAIVSIIVGTLLTLVRDADADAVAQAMGVETAPVGQRPVAASIWPIVAGLGLTFVVVGMAINTFVFGVGLAVLAIVAFEWTMTAWADRATGDPSTNIALRNQLMGPFEVPLLGLLGGAVFVMAVSRIFIAYHGTGAVVIGAIVSVIMLAAAWFFVSNPDMNKNVITLITTGIVASVLVFGLFSLTQIEHGDEKHGDDHSEDDGDHSDDEAMGVVIVEAAS